MYELIITTKYNTITLTTDDYNSPEIQEIISQPYVISVELNKVEKDKANVRVRRKNNEQ